MALTQLLPVEFLAYIAGIIDGEGNVRMIGKKLGSLQLSVTNTCKLLIEKLYNTFGGSVSTRSRGVGKDGCHRKIQHTWTLSGHKAEFLLRQCFPYFIVKKPHVEVVLKSCAQNSCWCK